MVAKENKRATEFIIWATLNFQYEKFHDVFPGLSSSSLFYTSIHLSYDPVFDANPEYLWAFKAFNINNPVPEETYNEEADMIFNYIKDGEPSERSSRFLEMANQID